MALDIQVCDAGGVDVLRCRGRLVLGQGTALLREAARQALSDGHALALDLAGVTQMDAHGVGVLAELCEAAQEAGLSFTLARAGDRVRRLLRLTRLDTVIPAPGDAGEGERPYRLASGGALRQQPHLTNAFALSAR